MSKVVDTVVDTGGDIFGLGRSIFDKTVGALWDSLSPEVPEEDLATLGQGLQKGIDQPRRITFGRDLVGGVIAHQAEVEKGDKKWMQLIVLINGAPIDALEEIYIADKKLSEYPTESWDYELSDGRQTIANTKAMAKMAGWTSEHIGFGQSYIFIEIENNREVFEDGISDMGFLIRGARVWDPRDTSQDPDDESTWIWSQNAVLCALHYVRFYGAYEVPFSRLPLQWWIAAINVCDENAEFTDAEGVVTTEPRYTTNGSFTFSTKPIEVLNQLEACFAGKIFRQMGQWYVRVGAWYGNPTHTINQDDVHGNIKIKWHADLRDRANVVRATFTDPDQNYDRTDAPPVVSAGYQAIDNQILEKSISLPFVRSSTTAQRLATIHLEQTRLGEIELPLKHKGLAAAVGRTVYLNLPGESINNKVYRVTERRFRLDGGVTLMCVEDAPDLWADNLVPGAQNLTPNSDYLVGKPQPVFDVRVTIDGDGNGIIKWNHPAPLAVHEYDVEFINTAANEAVFKTTVTYTQVVIPNLQLGEYTARISAKNIFGQRSLLVAVQFSVLTPTLPTVYVTADYNQITLTAEITAAGIGTAFEWEFLGSVAQPQSGERVLAQIYNRIGLKSETEYQFRVRSVNHLGSSDWVNITATTTTVDLTEYINELPLTKLSKDAQTLIEDINTQVDRLRPETEDNLPDVLNRTISELNLEKKTRVDIEKGVLDLSANYTAWRQEYEKRQLNNERLIDASVYIDPDNGTIVNRAFAYTDKTFSEANIKIDGVNSKIEFEANRITESENRLTDAESKLLVQADKINAKVSFTEMQGEIASAIEALKPAYSWQFNSNDEDFIGVDSHSALGYVVSLSAITSPAISYNADENPMFRLRVRLHENATWLGQIKFNDNSNVINVPAPVGNDWQTLQVDATGTDGYTGVITILEFNLGECDIDFIEVGKRGANDLALNDIKLRTTTLENDIDGGTGIMAQYATTAWVDELGYQTQSNVDAILNTFDTTYKVSATLQEFSDNDTLQKANNAEQFINGAEAYIKSQITSFNAAEGGIDSKFSNVDQKLDALDGSINQNIVQVRGLELDLKNADLNAILAAANDLLRNNELQKQGVKLAIAETNLKANANDLESVAQSTLDLFTIFDKSQASFNELVDVVSKDGQALVTVEQNLKAKIEDDTNKALATAQEYTRTAIGYCVDAEGNITSENDAVKCVTDGGLWVDGPLAEYIANMQISDGDETASIKELRQLFKTVDGKLVARGGWTLDNNGRVTGIAGYNDGDIASLDLVGDVIRQGAMVGGEFVPTSYVDNSDPLNPQHVIRGRLELGDGHKVESLDDIKAQDGNTIEIERVYSVNGQTAWHFPMVDGDVYQRERKLVNGEAVTGWSGAAKIKGDKGDTPTITDLGNGSYQIQSGSDVITIHDGLNAPIPTVTDNGDGTHTITDGDGNSIVVSDGDTPVKGVDYFDGKDGSYVSNIYKAATSKPETPTGGSFDGTAEVIPTGWQDTPYYEEGKITYTSKNRYHDTGAALWEKGAWSDSAEYIIEGKKGDAGTSAINFYTSAGAFSRNGLDYVKQTNQGWNAGVSSQEVFVHATASARVSSTSQVMLGLSYESCQGDYNNLNYAFYSSNGELAVYEKGELKGWFGPATGENRLSVVWDGVFVKYYKDATLIYTSATKPTAPVLFDLCAYDEGATFAEPIFAATGHGGERGLDGSRGSVEVQVPTSTGAWSDSTATAAVPGGIPVEHDRVTIYKAGDPAVQTIKRYNGSAWVSYTLHVHGSALIEDTLDGKVLRAGTRIESPRIDLIGNNFMKIELASGFGPEQLWYWYGPKLMKNGLPDLDQCTRANATEWKDVNGNTFTKGTFIAGALESSVSTSQQVNNPSRELEFTSNGNTIYFAVSYQYRRTYFGPNNGDRMSVYCPSTPIFQPVSGTLYLERWNGSSWVVVVSNSITGNYSCSNGFYESEPGTPNHPYIATTSSQRSFTYNHTPGSGYQKYRVRAAVNNFISGAQVGQYLSLAASE